MNIFRHLDRPIYKQVFNDHIDLFASRIAADGNIIPIKILTLTHPFTASTDSMIRVINGDSRSCRTLPNMSSSTIRWSSNGMDLELLDNDRNTVGVIERSEINRIGFHSSNTTDIMIELGSIFRDVSRTGHMPTNYIVEEVESDRPVDHGESIHKSKKQSNLVDDIPDDVFTMESIIDRIRNCGAVADAKHVPVIIRFGEQKLMITDTSIEDNFLYFDVVEVPKKELKINSLKFSDYFNYAFIDNIGDTIRTSGGNITMDEINRWTEASRATTVNMSTSSTAASASINQF